MKSAMREPRGIASFRAILALGAFILLDLPGAGLQAAVQFEEVSATAGLGAPGETYGASWRTLDADRCPDLFISRYREVSRVLINRGDGRFHSNAGQVVPWDNRAHADTHGDAGGDFGEPAVSGGRLS
jgi:hypothetical protein